MNDIIFKTLLLKGEAGNNIASIEKTATSGLVDTYTITLTDGSTTSFEVTNGRSIVSIVGVSTEGSTNVYEITYNDDTTQQIEVEKLNYHVDTALSATSTNPVENRVVTGKFGEIEENIEVYSTKEAYRRIYVNSTTGSDNNDGLTTTTPVKTLEKAIKCGYKGGNEFRIYFQDDEEYIFPYITMNGTTIHFNGNTATKIIFNANMAFYNCHLNFSKCIISSTGNWYVDNTYTILKDCVFECGYTHNGGAFQANDCEFSNLTLNFCVGWIVDCVFNDLTNTNKTNSLELKTSYIRISGTFKTNYTSAPTVAFLLMYSTMLLASQLVHQGATPQTSFENSASIMVTTRDRYNTYGTVLYENGGFTSTDYFTIKGSSLTRRINELVLPAYFTETNKIRFSIYNTDFYPFSNISAVIESMNVYIDNSTVTPTVSNCTVSSHNSNIVVDCTLSDLTRTVDENTIVRVSISLTMSV